MHLIAKLRVMHKDIIVVVNPHAIIRVKSFFKCRYIHVFSYHVESAAMVSRMQLDFNLFYSLWFQPVVRARKYESYYGEGASYEY